MNILDKYEITTSSNVKMGDLVLCEAMFGNQLLPIEKVYEIGSRLRATVEIGDYILDDTLVLTREGKTLIGRNLYNKTIQVIGESKPKITSIDCYGGSSGGCDGCGGGPGGPGAI
jgi:hypothetical protein